jgi:fatty-acyl-CoA synthase
MLTGEILRLSAMRHPKRIALICGERRIDYDELDRAANRFANAVLGLGIGKGDAVAIMSRNLPEYVVAHFGNARTGAILVNTAPAYAPDELIAIVGGTRARLLVVEAAFQTKIADVIDRLLHLEHIVVIGEPMLDHWANFDDFLAGADESPPAVTLSDTDPFAITFTGGTTGMPKGAMVNHRARFVSCWTTAIEHEVAPGDIVGLLTPFYHAMGSVVWTPTAIFMGATSVIQTGWDPDAFINAVEEHGITCSFMVPIQLQQILSDEHFDAGKLSSLRKIACSGAIIPPDLVHEIAAKLPLVRFVNHYGQSETGPVCTLRPDDPRDKAATIGRPAIGVELRLVDGAGNDVPQGEPGEIIVRGPFLMDGYFENPEETGLYFRGEDGWGWTGDLATADEEGFLTLVGRSKDMIISGGINIYPREVEIALEKHQAVRDCTVFGIPDEKWGEALCAYVVVDVVGDGAVHGAVTEETIIAHCTEHLARFKRPKIVRFVAQIPKTPSGKVQKPVLRAAFLAEIGLG